MGIIFTTLGNIWHAIWISNKTTLEAAIEFHYFDAPNLYDELVNLDEYQYGMGFHPPPPLNTPHPIFLQQDDEPKDDEPKDEEPKEDVPIDDVPKEGQSTS